MNCEHFPQILDFSRQGCKHRCRQLAYEGAAIATTRNIGRYEVLHRIAAGGMGEVLLARTAGAAGFSKFVVIKRILPHLIGDGEVAEGFVGEAKLLLLLDHPHIVQVLDFGQHEGMYYMVMEYVHGYDLRALQSYCEKHAIAVPIAVCVRIVADVLAALSFAHNRKDAQGAPYNIVHRDVSPQNVLIAHGGQVKLTDFGIAKVLRASGDIHTARMRGKLRYLAPEAIAGHTFDQRSDVFAVGVVLFETLTGKRLFEGSNHGEILDKVRAAHVPPMAALRSDVPPELEAIVRRALAKEPADRFPDASAMSAALAETAGALGEHAARQQLATFIEELYAREDFPLDRPKALDPAALPARFSEATPASETLEPTASSDNLATETLTQGTPQQRTPSARVATRSGRATRPSLVVAVAALVVAAAVGAYFALSKGSSRATSPSGDFIVFKKPALALDAGPPRLPRDAASAPHAKASHVDLGPPKPSPPPRLVPFTPAHGVRTFGRHLTRINGCFNRHPPPPGVDRVAIASTLGSDGRVTAVQIRPSALAGQPVARCLSQVARRIHYRARARAGTVFTQTLRVNRR